MEEVLKLAGYHLSRIKNWQAVVLEPAFWQALGKALNWSGWMCRNCRLGKVLKICGCNNAEAFLIKPWLYYALRFFELRMTGGDEEKFWKELINPPFISEVVNGEAIGLTNHEKCYGCGTVQTFKGYCVSCKQEKREEKDR